MKADKRQENERASRISFRITHCHISLTKIYEDLVDREFSSVEKEAKYIIIELKSLLKSMQEDDF
jgi:hypothetical protein